MTTGACYSPRLDDALAFAASAFRHQVRKSTGVPYLSHLLQVMVHVAEGGGDEEQMIAALLHDYLEDIEGGSREDLEVRFGIRVADLVEGMSDTTVRPKPPWKERKEAHVRHLRGAPAELKLIAAADKLHNAQCTCRDLAVSGSVIWQRFRAGRDDQLWYYRAAVAALADGWSHPLLERLRAQVDELERLA
jgi:(p)ppGpp synthase/HD superfamily hydrolase